MRKTLAIVAAALLVTSCGTRTVKKLDVYPTPQCVEFGGKYIEMPAEGYRAECTSDIDADALEILSKTLKINENAATSIKIEAIDTVAKLQQSGAYTIAISTEGISIGAYDDRSMFYAAQTLKQLAGEGTKLPVCNIVDYPDVAFRGVVEGFYGNPWTFENRVSQLRMYGRMKMNTYIFGPKDDPYHRALWREPYPDDEARNIQALVTEAKKNKVDFVWAIHPGMDIKWNETDRQAAVNKLMRMYDLGVRGFAVFFDDITGEGTDAHKQAAFMNYLKQEVVDAKDDIQQLILCPTEYNREWANSDYLDILGEELDPFVRVMWTGDKVVCDITNNGISWVNNRIKRNCYIWWNFPVNDYSLAYLPMGPVYGLDKEISDKVVAFVSNPMEYAEASKVAIWSVAEFVWNAKEYDSTASWERACKALVPEAPEAFRLFCEHNASIGPNTWLYEREESFNSREMINQFTKSITEGAYNSKEANDIATLMEQIQKAPAEIRSKATNKELLSEIEPWLAQTENLGKAGMATMEMLAIAKDGDAEGCRMAYAKVKEAIEAMHALNRKYRKGEQDGVRSGSQVLMPFIEAMLRHVENTLLPEQKPAELPTIIAGSAYADELSCFVDDDVVGIVPHFALLKLAPGDFVGFKIESHKQPTAIVYDLRSSKASQRSLEWSADGNSWEAFAKSGADRLDTIPADDSAMRYVRLVNTSNDTIAIRLGRFAALTK